MRHPAKLLAILFAALQLIGTAPLSAQAVATDAGGLVLQPGDVIRVVVWRRPEYSGDFPIGADGTVIHPLYREIRAGGQTVRSVEESMRVLLSKLEATPQFVVAALLHVAVGGEVRTPNLMTLPAGTTLAQAVALAGGPTERGRLDRVHLVRGGRDTLLDLAMPGNAMAEEAVQSGDRILVERRTSVFRDYIVPLASITGAAAAILNIILR